jgi:hypothetical protein
VHQTEESETRMGTWITATGRKAGTVVLIGAVGFLLAFLIPRSQCVAALESISRHRVKLAGMLRSQSDVLVPTRALVQVAIIVLCAIAANLVAWFGGGERRRKR